MSIWSSVHLGVDLAVPPRCNYCGEKVAQCACDGPVTMPDGVTIDVATACGWHERIRLSMCWEMGWDEAYMSVDEARLLIKMLTTAVALIEAAQ